MTLVAGPVSWAREAATPLSADGHPLVSCDHWAHQRKRGHGPAPPDAPAEAGTVSSHGPSEVRVKWSVQESDHRATVSPWVARRPGREKIRRHQQTEPAWDLNGPADELLAQATPRPPYLGRGPSADPEQTDSLSPLPESVMV